MNCQSRGKGASMHILITLALIISFLVLYGLVEYRLHLKNLNSISVRIHVNGTRGKSSVTRLIAAGLREGGIRAFAKTTGSVPRVITADGAEFPVFRNAKANVIEQLRIVNFAAANRATALVIECMALQPYLQTLCEFRLIKSTHGVITNAREDHLDVMGPHEKNVAEALLGTAPVNATLFTAERDYVDLFTRVCEERNSSLVLIGEDDINDVTDAELASFSYVEHKENIALALRVCQSVGVSREKALCGMKKVAPDVGAMTDLRLNFFGKEIFFVNGFAANDPESTERIWRMTLEKHPGVERNIMVINCRIDRPDRSKQLGRALGDWPKADKYVIIGSGSHFLLKNAIDAGIEPHLFVNAENLLAENIFEEILNYCRKSTLVMGIGNIAGPGLELMKFFSNRAEMKF